MAQMQKVPAPQRPSRRIATLVVWGLWTVMFAALGAYIWYVNANVPMADDFNLVPFYTGHEQPTLAWLWEPYNEHRIPLPKLILIVMGWLTNSDYRGGLIVNWLTLGAASAALIVAARKVRGSTPLTDAVIPLALLHWGQSDNVIFSLNMNHVLAAGFGCVCLTTLACVRGLPSRGQVLLLTACLLALPLCGASGVSLVPALTVWLTVAGLIAWRDRGKGSRQAATLALGGAVLVCGLTILYFTGYAPAPGDRPDLTVVLRTAAQFLAMSLGPAGQPGWPLSGLAVVGLAVASLGVLGRAFLAKPHERLRALGLACSMAGVACLALGVGWGRGAGFGEAAGFANRYVTLAAPLLCAIHLTWSLYGSRVVSVILFLLMGILLVFNTRVGVAEGKEHQLAVRLLLADI